ncbi:hypothetical protein [Rivularia sp. UHCC 0363]|uniref:hypothetical protein n=1 Tax=Rivularia sp. UHCC 0363 TaxID=3110244 RepID=UPI002B1F8C21|nr:hypothetical protein [Rivularia sp. UHCC 0363]MEA5597831.1 hypothetical protein [Rivularia sp. UHCC 0363]
MDELQEDPEKPQKSGRVAATSVIWGVSGGMLTICIPLVIVTKTGAILPLATIVGAALATFAVWLGENNNSQVKQLEDRIAFLETIVTTQNSNKD